MASFLEIPIPFICFHRGYSRNAPENTLSAINMAIQANAKMIEIDIQLTKDKRLVVVHDKRIDRVSNGRGKVSNLNYSDLRKLDFGSWYSKEFIEERIPAFNEVLDICKGKVAIDIEIKSNGNFSVGKEIANKVLELIINYGMEHSVFISSFDWKVINYINSLNSGVITGLISNNHFSKFFLLKYAERHNIPCLIINYKLVTKIYIQEVHQKKKLVFIYTLDDKKKIDEFCRDEIDGIITNGF